jgi:hypothetical protein
MVTKNLDLFVSLIGRDKGVAGMFDSVLGKSNQLKNELGNRGGGLIGSIFSANVAADLFVGGLSKGLEVATAGVGALTNAFGEAVNTEQALLTGANNYAAVTGIAFGDAEESIGRMNARLTEVASSLPGTTGEYRKLAVSIIDNVGPAFMGLDGTLDQVGLEDSLVSLSTSFGLLGTTAGVSGDDVSKGLSKMLSGRSVSELGELLLFEQQPALLSEIEKQLDIRNVETLKDLSMADRVKLAEDIGKKFASDEYIGEINQTTGAMLEGFMSTMLDSEEGLFGLNRDVLSARDGTQSVYGQFSDTIKLLIGPSGIFAGDGPLSNLMNALGIEMKDPMLMIYRGVEWVNIQLEGVVELTNDLAERIQGGLDIGESIGGFLGKLSGDTLGQKFGDTWAGLLTRGIELTGGFISDVPWGKIGNEAGEFIGAGVTRLIRNFPYGTFAGFTAKALIGVTDFVVSTGVGILRGIATEVWDWLKNGVTKAVRAMIANPFAIWNAPRTIADGITYASENSGRTSVSANRGRGRDNALRPSAALTAKSNSVRRSGRFDGQGVDGMNVMAAVDMERAAVPSADIVIANSTEAIIPQGSALIKPGSGRSGGSINQTINFSPTLVLPQGSPREMAEQVLAVLNSLVAENMEAQLV